MLIDPGVCPGVCIILTLKPKSWRLKAKIMHTPGHTPGSMSVIIDDEDALVGDTMFGVFWWTIYPPFANDTTQMINSWGNLLQTNSKVFIPSHGSANSRFLVEIDYKKRTATKIKLDG